MIPRAVPRAVLCTPVLCTNMHGPVGVNATGCNASGSSSAKQECRQTRRCRPTRPRCLCPPTRTPRTLLTGNVRRPPRSTRRTCCLCRSTMRCAPPPALRQSQLHFLCLDCNLCLQPAHHCIAISTRQRSHSNHLRLQRVTLCLMLRIAIAALLCSLSNRLSKSRLELTIATLVRETATARETGSART
jgi:hypothetical protein